MIGKFCGWVGIFVANIFMTLFVFVPAIQYIWDLLVFQIYQFHLQNGVVLFAFLASVIIKYKKVDEPFTINIAFDIMVARYVFLGVCVVLAKIFSLFIKGD